MPMLYHSEPDRAEPARWIWFSVETPTTFKECKLPASEADWTWDDRRNYRELETLAQRYGKPVHRSGPSGGGDEVHSNQCAANALFKAAGHGPEC